MRFVVFSQKGGVGKSTIAANLAAVSAKRGERTLLVDLDPQSNASQYLLGAAAADARPNLADAFEESLSFHLFKTDPKVYVHASPFPKLDLIPSHGSVEGLLAKLEARHKIHRIREIVDGLGYGSVFLDTPPAYNVLTLSALVAADRVLIPFDCDDFARREIRPLLERIAEVRADHNSRLRVEGIVVNQFQGRANFPQQAVEALVEDDLPVLEPYISSSVRVRESHHAARPMVFFEASHKVTGEFEGLYDRLRSGRRERRKAS